MVAYRQEVYAASVLTEVVNITRNADTTAQYQRENPPGNMVDNRPATAEEELLLASVEGTDRLDQARQRLRAFDPATANAGNIAEAVRDLIRFLR